MRRKCVASIDTVLTLSRGRLPPCRPTAATATGNDLVENVRKPEKVSIVLTPAPLFRL